MGDELEGRLDDSKPMCANREPHLPTPIFQLHRGGRLLQKKLSVPMVASMAIGRASEGHAANDEAKLGIRFRMVPMGGSSHGQYKHRGERHPHGSEDQKHRDHGEAIQHQ